MASSGRGRSGQSRRGGGFRRSSGSELPVDADGVVERQAGIGDFRWVADEAAFAELCDELAACEEYGLDTEFHRERTYYAHLALLQVAWPGGIALVDPLALDVSGLARVLDGPGLAILHAADQDLEVLERACGAPPSRLFDTQVAAGFLGQVSPSLVNLVERTIGIRLKKGDQLTDWTRRPLSAGQLSYAAGDVAFLLEMKQVLSEQLEANGRLEWALAECALALGKDRSPSDLDEAWWRLPHARQLRGPARAVAQTVCAWREARARRIDLPVRFVLSDLAVASIAQRPPLTRDELARIRGVDGRSLAGGAGDELLAAVRAGTELASSKLRTIPASHLEQPSRAVTTLATAYAAQRAGELELDPALLATRADLTSFLQDPPRGRLTVGWRHDLLGDGLRRLTEGQAALAFDGRDELVLEQRSHRPLEAAPPTSGQAEHDGLLRAEPPAEPVADLEQ